MNPWQCEISTLDSERDAQRIVLIDASLECPWDTQHALELAFCRTVAVPSIATLLGSTGGFTDDDLRADSVERPLWLAAVDGDGEARNVFLLARGRKPDEHP